MEFEFNCEQVTKADKSGFAILDSDMLNALPKKSFEYMETLLDTMGKYSSKAQRLSTTITSFKRLQMNADRQKIYIYSQKKKCLGYLKTGYRKLFVSTEFGEIKEINPLCLLDFYVNEDVQRQGIGKKLFDMMTQDSSTRPEKIAYDRPSEKLLGFLAKHFGLKRYLPQNNNFVVFSQYFSTFSSSTKPKTATKKADDKGKEEKSKGIYESKPSYRTTYDKGKKKDYDETSNIVNRDYINQLIIGSQPGQAKSRKMAANEESKDGFNQMYGYGDEPVYKPTRTAPRHVEEVPKPVEKFEKRAPLVDTTNDVKRQKQTYRNPITGECYEINSAATAKPKVEVAPKEEQKVPSGAELDKMIREKEAELQEVMGRLSVSSKQSIRKEQHVKLVPQRTALNIFQS